MNILSMFGNRRGDRYSAIVYLIGLFVIPVGLWFIPSMSNLFIVCTIVIYVIYGVFMHAYKDDDYVTTK